MYRLNRKPENGFTLIDLSIVLIIVGLIVAGSASTYKQNLRERVIETQEANMNSIRDALAFYSANGVRNANGIDWDGDGLFTNTAINEIDFSAGAQGIKLVEKIDNNGDGDYQDTGDVVAVRADYSDIVGGGIVDEYFYAAGFGDGEILNGFSLPCPAPLNIDLNAANSGIPYSDGSPSSDLPTALEDDIPGGETRDCDASSLGLGWDSDAGVYVVQGNSSARVIIGAVPFRALGIAGDKTIDVYKNKIFYAVSTPVTVAGEVDGSSPTGEILVDNGSLLPVPAQFLILSAGPDGSGAWNAAGQAVGAGCPTAGVQRENCDFTAGVTSADASSFAIAGFAETQDANRFDDTLAFTFTDGEESPFFTRGASASGAQFDIVNKNSGDMVLSSSLIANQNLVAANSASFGSTTPALTKLDVAGEMKLSMTGTNADLSSQLTCNSASEGSIRYNAEAACLEFCDSTAWQPSCAPGCTQDGARLGEGESYDEVTTSLDGCTETTTTMTCTGYNQWTDSASTSRNTCGCTYQGRIYNVGATYERSLSDAECPNNRFNHGQSSKRRYQCQGDGSWQIIKSGSCNQRTSPDR